MCLYERREFLPPFFFFTEGTFLISGAMKTDADRAAAPALQYPGSVMLFSVSVPYLATALRIFAAWPMTVTARSLSG